jgi:lipid-A-disaccharide synthase
VSRLLPVFRESIALLVNRIGPVEILMPCVDRLANEITRQVRDWPVPVKIIRGEDEKWKAFRTARAALAASGTVTLELALSQVPMVTAYKVNPVEAMIARRVLRLTSVILPNIILGEKVVPEFLQEECTASNLSDALLPLMQGGDAREVQLSAFDHLEEVMRLSEGQTPSAHAAEIVLSVIASAATQSR